jgi:hypothetical protein
MWECSCDFFSYPIQSAKLKNDFKDFNIPIAVNNYFEYHKS